MNDLFDDVCNHVMFSLFYTRHCVCDEIQHSVARSPKIGHNVVHKEALELKDWESDMEVGIYFLIKTNKCFLLMRNYLDFSLFVFGDLYRINATLKNQPRQQFFATGNDDGKWIIMCENLKCSSTPKKTLICVFRVCSFAADLCHTNIGDEILL